jgi:hypothetical protein
MICNFIKETNRESKNVQPVAKRISYHVTWPYSAFWFRKELDMIPRIIPHIHNETASWYFAGKPNDNFMAILKVGCVHFAAGSFCRLDDGSKIDPAELSAGSPPRAEKCDFR